MPNYNNLIPKENIAKVEEVRYLEQYYPGCKTNEDGTLTVTYELGPRYRFDMGGDLKRALEVSGNREYILYWLRDKLRKFENEQIIIIRLSTEKRDSDYEEKIRKQMWEDININEKPHGFIQPKWGCTETAKTINSPPPSRSSSEDSCIIS